MYCLVVIDDYSRFTWVFFLAFKDETSAILKTFIIGIENLVYHKVKVIRCDNETEFKNREINQFCEMKGITRQYSVARTPQQNRVAERRNRTLIEAPRTMLSNSKLPTTFCAEAVNIACYVQNRVLVVKPYNKTPYEIFHGKTPTLSFMRPFGCPVTILNTKDHLGKFDGKADEGFFVGYSLNSKSFRVFNNRTIIVEDNFYIRFSENTPNIAGSGPNCLFDIDALTKSMNYKPVVARNQSNGNAGTKACDDASKARMETIPDKDTRQESECKDQEKEDNVNSTNNVNVVGTNKVNAVGANTNNELPFDPEMPALEDISTFNFLSDHEDDEEEADMNNMDTSIQVILTLTTRIHKDHPLDQMDVKSAFFYRKIKEEAYVCQPLGFEDPDFLDKVYKVEKALYGLHQAPRAWIASEQKKDVIFISQDKYVAEILKKYDFLEVKNANTPMETQKPLLKDKDAYTDSDYAGASLDRKSTTGGCQFLRCILISWQCKKQTVVANSKTEAEYVATSSCCG
nr:ribonuclease H-like domain-containing protein [Tanacetum cinerariifolium]GEY29675.1 ribonuclease H-like domain-containing protein [Tanacetum cinerariifolium]GEY29764.1 ribonuclease H-like domain-containing protein [Tanacetum cinerariifolium]